MHRISFHPLWIYLVTLIFSFLAKVNLGIQILKFLLPTARPLFLQVFFKVKLIFHNLAIPEIILNKLDILFILSQIYVNFRLRKYLLPGINDLFQRIFLPFLLDKLITFHHQLTMEILNHLIHFLRRFTSFRLLFHNQHLGNLEQFLHNNRLLLEMTLHYIKVPVPIHPDLLTIEKLRKIPQMVHIQNQNPQRIHIRFLRIEFPVHKLIYALNNLRRYIVILVFFLLPMHIYLVLLTIVQVKIHIPHQPIPLLLILGYYYVSRVDITVV